MSDKDSITLKGLIEKNYKGISAVSSLSAVKESVYNSEIIGFNTQKHQLINALSSGLDVLLIGFPGIGKSALLVKTQEALTDYLVRNPRYEILGCPSHEDASKIMELYMYLNNKVMNSEGEWVDSDSPADFDEIVSTVHNSFCPHCIRAIGEFNSAEELSTKLEGLQFQRTNYLKPRVNMNDLSFDAQATDALVATTVIDKKLTGEAEVDDVKSINPGVLFQYNLVMLDEAGRTHEGILNKIMHATSGENGLRAICAPGMAGYFPIDNIICLTSNTPLDVKGPALNTRLETILFGAPDLGTVKEIINHYFNKFSKKLPKDCGILLPLTIKSGRFEEIKYSEIAKNAFFNTVMQSYPEKVKLLGENPESLERLEDVMSGFESGSEDPFITPRRVMTTIRKVFKNNNYVGVSQIYDALPVKFKELYITEAGKLAQIKPDKLKKLETITSKSKVDETELKTVLKDIFPNEDIINSSINELINLANGLIGIRR